MISKEGAVRQKDKEFYESLRAMWGEDCRCSGCSRKVNMDSPTTYSHIIPKKRRQDLRWEPDNMVPDCWDCHHIWDNMPWSKKVQLMNIGERLAYIKNNDPELYNAYIAKIEDYT
jgi:5-methylcytosine-specific restriction endonuclease McrA